MARRPGRAAARRAAAKMGKTQFIPPAVASPRCAGEDARVLTVRLATREHSQDV